jgi:hypothetical protein
MLVAERHAGAEPGASVSRETATISLSSGRLPKRASSPGASPNFGAESSMSSMLSFVYFAMPQSSS